MFKWLKREEGCYKKLRFEADTGKLFAPQQLGSLTVCSGYDGKDRVCSFENMKLEGQVLRIGHFALHGVHVGKGVAEEVLRSFAAHVAKYDKHIECIEFQLSKSTEDTMSSSEKLVKLAGVREALFIKIGVKSVEKAQISRVSWQVSGTWPKQNWNKV